jgi:glycosyltransferase involved in cell wall biosynthesis
LSYCEEPASPIKDYIFSYGNSDRDFDTLVRAVVSLNINTYILSARYQPRHPIPENVTIIRDRISEKELIQWIASSRLVVLPLQDYRISAGQLSMLEVMALARPLIITENMATKEYADHQQTALFFDAGNDEALAEHIGYLWNHREVAEQIGQQARKDAVKLNDRRMIVFERIFECCVIEIEKGV